MRKSVILTVLLLLVATPVLADSVILDDQIIDGSLCVGFDCVNGEQFAFNTIVAKENNTRLHFEDTSSTARFPQTDWTLVANDVTNGGRNRFSIEDATARTEPFTVMGSAPTGAIFVAENGAIGLGTQAPERTVHVAAVDTPTVRLQQTAVAGWPEAAWDVGSNEANFFVRDVEANTLPLRVLPGAVDDTLVVEAGGNVSVAGMVMSGSSRAIKKGVAPVNAKAILDKASRLDINHWQYKRDGSGAKHMGPMAEDFHAAFGLGADDAHIAASDLAAVALASVQALRTELDRTKKENEALKKRLDRLEARLAR